MNEGNKANEGNEIGNSNKIEKINKKQERLFRMGLYVIGAVMLFSLAACSSSGGGSQGGRPQIPSIMSPDGISNRIAAAKNDEGVDHLVQGHYKVALKHLKQAISAKGDFAEAHFNLAVALDGLGQHGEATASFKLAKKFGGNNQKIAESAILKEHLNL